MKLGGWAKEKVNMRHHIRPTLRNHLDLNDPAQVRVVKRRLHVSEAELKALAGKVGHSIAAITKEAGMRRTAPPPMSANVPLPL